MDADVSQQPRRTGRRRTGSGALGRLHRADAGRRLPRLHAVRQPRRSPGAAADLPSVRPRGGGDRADLRAGGAQPRDAASARPAGRILRARLLQPVRRAPGGDLPVVDPRHGAGGVLQHRTGGERSGAVRHRGGGRPARIRVRAGIDGGLLHSRSGARLPAARDERTRPGVKGRSIDLNCDMGEIPELVADGTQKPTPSHVKPHGALYNAAAGDRTLAAAIVAGVARARRDAGLAGDDLILVGLAGSSCLAVYAAEGFRTAPEAFADRRYEPEGTLRSRAFPDALLTDPEEAATQALRLARDAEVVATGGAVVSVRASTLCLHGDTPGEARIAAAVATKLRTAG